MRKNSIKNTRINNEVHKELSNIIRSEIKDPRINPMTSVVAVNVAPDLKTCKAYISVLGDVKDKNVVIIDDIADTAGTLCKAAEVMKADGAKSVRALVSHGLMSGPACERVTNSALEELVYTDSIPFNQERCSKVSIVSMAKPIAETILAIQNHRSVSELNIH